MSLILHPSAFIPLLTSPPNGRSCPCRCEGFARVLVANYFSNDGYEAGCSEGAGRVTEPRNEPKYYFHHPYSPFHTRPTFEALGFVEARGMIEKAVGLG